MKNFNGVNEKEKLDRQMKIMEKEIENFVENKKRIHLEKESPKPDGNIKEIREEIETINKKSDDFLLQMSKMKEQINSFSDLFEDLQRKKKEIFEKKKKLVKADFQKNEIDMKIQFFIDNILNFQKEMMETNSILTEYVLYFDGIEKKIDLYENFDAQKPDVLNKVKPFYI